MFLLGGVLLVFACHPHLALFYLQVLFTRHSLVLYDLVQELALDGHLGGRNSSFGESEARGSVLEVSRSRTTMSLSGRADKGCRGTPPTPRSGLRAELWGR